MNRNGKMAKDCEKNHWQKKFKLTINTRKMFNIRFKNVKIEITRCPYSSIRLARLNTLSTSEFRKIIRNCVFIPRKGWIRTFSLESVQQNVTKAFSFMNRIHMEVSRNFISLLKEINSDMSKLLSICIIITTLLRIV